MERFYALSFRICEDLRLASPRRHTRLKINQQQLLTLFFSSPPLPFCSLEDPRAK